MQQKAMKIWLPHGTTHTLTKHLQHQATQSQWVEKNCLGTPKCYNLRRRTCLTFIFDRFATFSGDRCTGGEKGTNMLHLSRKVSADCCPCQHKTMSCIHKCCPYHQKSVQEEACLQPLTSSKRCACHASQILDVHIRPLVDVHLRPLFDVHFRPPSRPSTHSGTQIGPWVDGEQVLPKHLYVDGWILYLDSQINLRGWTWIKRPNSRDSMFILWLSMMDSSHRYLINHGINRTSSRIQPGLPQLSTVLQGSGDFLPTSLQQGIQGLPLFCGKGLGTPWNLQMSKRYGKTWNFNKIIIMIYKMNVWPGDNLCIDTKSMKSKRNRHRARVRVFLKRIALVLATESRSIKMTCYCQEMKEAIVSVKDACAE